VSSTTPPSPSGTPSVSTSDLNAPICFGAKFTSARTRRLTRVVHVDHAAGADVDSLEFGVGKRPDLIDHDVPAI